MFGVSKLKAAAMVLSASAIAISTWLIICWLFVSTAKCLSIISSLLRVPTVARMVIKSAGGLVAKTRLKPHERRYSDAVTPIAVALFSMAIFSPSKTYTLIDLVRLVGLSAIPYFWWD